MNLAIRMTAEPIRSLPFGSIGAAYTAIGGALSNPARILIIFNETDEAVMLSLDGVNDHIAVGLGQTVTINATANQVKDQGCFFAAHTTLFAKEITTPPTSGSLFVSVFYGTALQNV
jgi:hypothetical protein